MMSNTFLNESVMGWQKCARWLTFKRVTEIPLRIGGAAVATWTGAATVL
jgi:hypothetical protein